MKIEKSIPEGFKVEYDGEVLKVEGNGGEVGKEISHPMIDIDIRDDKIVFSTESKKRDVKSLVKTFSSHYSNLADGLEEDHVYRMKGVYAHFPMTIKSEGDRIVIENFMGEKSPRKIDIMDGVDVSVKGEEIELRGPDKEKVSQSAARIENACAKGNRDPRTFQDGVYIVEGDSDE